MFQGPNAASSEKPQILPTAALCLHLSCSIDDMKIKHPLSCLDPHSTRRCSPPLLLPYHTPVSWVLPPGKRIGTSKPTSFSLGFLQLGGIQDRRISLGSRGTYERERVFSGWKQVKLERYDSPEDRAGGNWKWQFCIRHHITAKGSCTAFLTEGHLTSSSQDGKLICFEK